MTQRPFKFYVTRFIFCTSGRNRLYGSMTLRICFRSGTKWAAPACICALISTLSPQKANATSLREALIIAYNNNPSLSAERFDLKVQNESLEQARLAFGPTAGLELTGANQHARVDQLDFFGQKSTSQFAANTGSAEVTLTQPLFSGGRLPAARNAAEADVFTSRQLLRAQENELFKEVAVAYLDIVRDSALIDIANHSCQILFDELKDVQERYASGAATISDKALVASRLAAARVNLSVSKADLNKSQLEFIQLVGVKLSAPSIPDALSNLPPSSSAALGLARNYNPVYLGALSAARSDEAKLAGAKAARMPTVSARLSGGSSPLDQYQPKLRDNNLTAEISLSLPLYTSGATTSSIRQASDRSSESRLKARAAWRSTQESVLQAWVDLHSTRESLEIQSEQVQAEQQAFSSLSEQYQNGLISTIDFLNAEQELSGSMADYERSRHDALDYEYNLLAAIGVLEVAFILPNETAYRPELDVRPLTSKGPSTPFITMVELFDRLGNTQFRLSTEHWSHDADSDVGFDQSPIPLDSPEANTSNSVTSPINMYDKASRASTVPSASAH